MRIESDEFLTNMDDSWFEETLDGRIIGVFWGELSPDDQEVMAAGGTRRTYSKGTVLFMENDRPTHVVIVLSGEVKLTRASADGREIIIELRGAGDLIGELASVDESRRNATVTAMEDVEAIVVPAATFRRMLLERGRIAVAVLTLVTEKLRQATDRRLAAGTSDALARLCGRLVELAGTTPPNSDGVIEIASPLTQQELAAWIGVSRDAVVLALKTLRELKWIETGRRTIRILDIEALRTRSAA